MVGDDAVGQLDGGWGREEGMGEEGTEEKEEERKEEEEEGSSSLSCSGPWACHFTVAGGEACVFMRRL